MLSDLIWHCQNGVFKGYLAFKYTITISFYDKTVKRDEHSTSQSKGRHVRVENFRGFVARYNFCLRFRIEANSSYCHHTWCMTGILRLGQYVFYIKPSQTVDFTSREYLHVWQASKLDTLAIMTKGMPRQMSHEDTLAMELTQLEYI